MRITRWLPVDWTDLFKQAGVAPQRYKLARSTVAQAWCLFIEEKDGVQLIAIEPPPMRDGETELRIAKGYWVFSAPSLAPLLP